tara:strand:+ start:779 stop:982 length:204 start_codon:yes stop_codon:yes gene_type:complete
MGLSPTMMGLAGDVNSVSGGSPEKGAEINAPLDFVDVNAFRLARKGLNALTDALTGTKAFEPRRPGM